MLQIIKTIKQFLSPKHTIFFLYINSVIVSVYVMGKWFIFKDMYVHFTYNLKILTYLNNFKSLLEILIYYDKTKFL